MKIHLRRVVSTHKLTFEEFTTILTQIESCLNSRPLVPLQCDEDGIEALTPGHFLTGELPESIPDPAFSNRTLSLLWCWYLCQALVRHFWQRWSTEYISSLRRYTQWHHPTRNVQVGDVVILQEDNMVPTKCMATCQGYSNTYWKGWISQSGHYQDCHWNLQEACD